jgi:hypothetical protein
MEIIMKGEKAGEKAHPTTLIADNMRVLLSIGG